MTAGPGDGRAPAAAGRGRLRASHADREQVIEVLKAAFVQGRLTKNELDARAGRTFAARTHGELAALTADLPAGLITAQSPGRATEPPMSRAAKAGTCLGIALALLAVVVFTGPGNPAERMFVLVVLIPLWMLLLGGLVVLHSWLEKRARHGQLPRRPVPGAAGRASRPASADESAQIPFGRTMAKYATDVIR